MIENQQGVVEKVVIEKSTWSGLGKISTTRM